MNDTGTTLVRFGAAVALLAAMGAGGCAPADTCPRVLFLDGAGWYTGDGPVRAGLKEAGYTGEVERFGWSAMLGPLPDHVMAGPDHPKVAALAERIVELRRANPDGQIVLMGLSAGTSILVHALQNLPPGVDVDTVVLLSPSVSARTDLRGALRHVKDRLYTTRSSHDNVLAVGGTAGAEAGNPAGIAGFLEPWPMDRQDELLYSKVTSIDWTKAYAQYGWDGGHVSATARQFICKVIAPRIVDNEKQALARASHTGPPAVPPVASASRAPAPILLAAQRPPAENVTSAPPRVRESALPISPARAPAPQVPPAAASPSTGSLRSEHSGSRTGQARPAPTIPSTGSGQARLVAAAIVESHPPAPAPPLARFDPAVVGKARDPLRMLMLGDDGDRRKAARDLKKFNMPTVVSALIDALRRDGSEDVRREAAISLGELKARDAQAALRQAAREDRDGNVRKAALKSSQMIEAADGIKQ